MVGLQRTNNESNSKVDEANDKANNTRHARDDADNDKIDRLMMKLID